MTIRGEKNIFACKIEDCANQLAQMCRAIIEAKRPLQFEADDLKIHFQYSFVPFYFQLLAAALPGAGMDPSREGKNRLLEHL